MTDCKGSLLRADSCKASAVGLARSAGRLQALHDILFLLSLADGQRQDQTH